MLELAKAQGFLLTRTSVMRNAPEESGVYGLSVPGKWVYIGHSFNIRKALLEYLSGQMPYVLQWQPSYFAFELIPYQRSPCAAKGAGGALSPGLQSQNPVPGLAPNVRGQDFSRFFSSDGSCYLSSHLPLFFSARRHAAGPFFCPARLNPNPKSQILADILSTNDPSQIPGSSGGFRLACPRAGSFLARRKAHAARQALRATIQRPLRRCGGSRPG